MKCYIMRGLPGSGKSEWIARNRPGMLSDRHNSWEVCSADDFHMVEGEYRYDPRNAGAAHAYCLRKFAGVLVSEREDRSDDSEVLVVDNTNTTAVELAPYVRLCEEFGVEYEIIFVQCDFATACKRNIHAVPPATIWNMYQNLISERIPPYWRQKFVDAKQ